MHPPVRAFKRLQASDFLLTLTNILEKACCVWWRIALASSKGFGGTARSVPCTGAALLAEQYEPQEQISDAPAMVAQLLHLEQRALSVMIISLK